MGIKLTPFSPIEMLHSDEEIKDFLADIYEQGEPALFVTVLGQVVKHKGVAKIAEETGLNREHLYKICGGKSQPTWDTIHRLLKALDVHLAKSSAAAA